MFSLTMLWEITLNFQMIPSPPTMPVETRVNSTIKWELESPARLPQTKLEPGIKYFFMVLCG